MPRPKTLPEPDLLAAVGSLLARTGPSGLTFAAAASATGLAPATLVQRYGSRQRLLHAALAAMWDGLDAATAAEDARQPEDPAGAVMLLLALSPDHGPVDDMSSGLTLLLEDFRDPQLRARGRAWHEALVMALGRRLSDRPEAQQKLGRLLAAQWQGAVIWWGFSRDGRLRDAVAARLDDWLHLLPGR